MSKNAYWGALTTFLCALVVVSMLFAKDFLVWVSHFAPLCAISRSFTVIPVSSCKELV
jgi:hypothetical protein